MQCLKCGKDVTSSPTFCDDCLAEMENCPVKPGTAVYIPKREPPARRSTGEKKLSTAALLSRTRRTLRWMYLLVVLLSLLLSAAAIMLIRTMDRASEPQPQGPAIGQNYTTNQQP